MALPRPLFVAPGPGNIYLQPGINFHKVPLQNKLKVRPRPILGAAFAVIFWVSRPKAGPPLAGWWRNQVSGLTKFMLNHNIIYV